MTVCLRKRLGLVLGLLALLGWGTAWAGETREQQLLLGDNTNRIFVQGMRPMAMGGAFVAVADDENALFYNPAGLARLTYWRFTLPYFMLGTDTHSFDQAQFWAGHYGEFSKFPNVSPETASALANTRIHGVTEGSWKYIGPHFGLGMWLTTDDLLTTSAILVPQAHWDVQAALVENMSFSWGWDIPHFGYLAVGSSLKATQREVSNQTHNALELADLKGMGAETQWGGGTDLGLMYMPTSEITVAVVAADLYTRIMEEVQPPNLKVGAAYKPTWLNFEDLATTLAFDVVELNWQGDNEFKNSPGNAAQINLSKTRLGVEFVLSGLLALRGGMYQGYPTAGIGLVTGFINIEWTYFGRELGTYPGQHAEWNQRLSIDWHCGAPVITPTPSLTPTFTPTPTPEATLTPTPTVTPEFSPTPRPTPQPTVAGVIPKLHGVFVGFTGTVTLVPKLPEDLSGVTSWNLVITNPRGTLIKREFGEGQPPKSFTWNAKDSAGERVPSREQYPYALTLTTAGEAKIVKGTAFIIDTIPKLYTSKRFELYPDKVYFSIKEPIQTVSWKLDVFDDANQVIRTYTTKAALFKAFAWDSKDQNNTVVPNNASYRYELSAVDAEGNQIVVADRIRPVLANILKNEGRTTIKIGNILFDTGKAFLTAEMFDKVIKSAYTVNDEPACEAVVNGHTDSVGKMKTNMKLSLVRAESVRQFLVNEQNVPDYQLTIQGWGPTKPVASNKTSDGRKRNRRDEVVIRLQH
ncbi:MAG: OmpA family protein [Candidatus Firestonebacteria bacterium]|nr:OmpA family protein [Candidatus Firestonebacteria bacterium]